MKEYVKCRKQWNCAIGGSIPVKQCSFHGTMDNIRSLVIANHSLSWEKLVSFGGFANLQSMELKNIQGRVMLAELRIIFPRVNYLTIKGSMIAPYDENQTSRVLSNLTGFPINMNHMKLY